MVTRQFALLIPIAALAACAAGSTIRVAEEDTGASEPVALAPTPAPEPASEETPSSNPTAAQPAAQEQGYAPYGNAGGLEIRRIGQWTRTGVSEARRLVIRDANAWAQFWSELGVGDQPAVDFTRSVVVAVAAGQRPTGGHEIVIDRVSQSDGQLTVEVVERTPGPNCMTTASLTQPVDVVTVPTTGAQGWSFVERKEIRGCR